MVIILCRQEVGSHDLECEKTSPRYVFQLLGHELTLEFLSGTLIIKIYIILKYITHIHFFTLTFGVCVQVHTPFVCPPLSISFKLIYSENRFWSFPFQVGFLVNPELFPSLPSSVLALQVYMTMLGFLHGYWGQNLGTHVCIESNLPIRSSSQTHV